MSIFANITETIGNTPMVRLQRLGKDCGADILLKLEFFNPLGSVKDRIGLNMIEVAEREGLLKPGMTIVEATSGNTGIALAFICASKGYPLTLVMPETMSVERRTLLLLLGAKLILTPASLGMKGAVAKSLELKDADPSIYIPSQFENAANPEIHRRTTAEEIWRETSGKVDIFIAGVGTGGTISGVGEILKGRKPECEIIAVEPYESSVISGEKAGPHKIQGIGAGFIPKILNRQVIDEVIRISSEDALTTARRLIKEEGIPVGISSGAALHAALRVAARPSSQGKTIVVIIPSYTERYLSTLLAEPERLAASQIPVSTVSEAYLQRIK